MAILISAAVLEVHAPAKSSVILPIPPSSANRSQRLLPSPSTVSSAAPAVISAARQRERFGSENLTTA